MENKKLWSTVKPFPWQDSSQRENKSDWKQKAIIFEFQTGETLNNLFSNIEKKLEIPKFDANSSITTKVKDPVFKAILKHIALVFLQFRNTARTKYFISKK